MHYYSYLPVKPDGGTVKSKIQAGLLRLINRMHRKINPLIDGKPPMLKTATSNFLDQFFKKELDGINELLGKDVMSIWFN